MSAPVPTVAPTTERKAQRVVPTPLSSTELSVLLYKNTSTVKDKEVDLNSVITKANVKKYLTLTKINAVAEQQLATIRKHSLCGQPLTTEEIDALAKQAKLDEAKLAKVAITEDMKLTPQEKKVAKSGWEKQQTFTAEDQVKLDAIQQQVDDFLANDASRVQLEKYNGAPAKEDKEATPPMSKEAIRKDVVSGFKFKFSVDSYEVITHVINLSIREIFLHSFEVCLSECLRVVRPTHVPWGKLHSKMLSGVYFNTPAVYNQVHSESSEDESEVEVEVEPEVETDVGTTGEDSVAPVQEKIVLRQFISTMFKALCATEPRFADLKLSRTLTFILDEIVFNVLDRYANILKTLLHVSGSKTVTDKFAVSATKLLLTDHITSSPENAQVILDVVYEHLEQFQAAQKERKERATKAAE